ncbi:hypothetical protein KFK09_026148 [Dendrobium nobile]|uniref:Uncharacterized protein n=1 Tax=Dendrobium nobile TaxID=94219 RepID=A0A8T3A5S3_DENNO|nr:hypothetical protein KFK09_026148 [Dendrobium nobile]
MKNPNSISTKFDGITLHEHAMHICYYHLFNPLISINLFIHSIHSYYEVYFLMR